MDKQKVAHTHSKVSVNLQKLYPAYPTEQPPLPACLVVQLLQGDLLEPLQSHDLTCAFNCVRCSPRVVRVHSEDWSPTKGVLTAEVNYQVKSGGDGEQRLVD